MINGSPSDALAVSLPAGGGNSSYGTMLLTTTITTIFVVRIVKVGEIMALLAQGVSNPVNSNVAMSLSTGGALSAVPVRQPASQREFSAPVNIPVTTTSTKSALPVGAAPMLAPPSKTPASLKSGILPIVTSPASAKPLSDPAAVASYSSAAPYSSAVSLFAVNAPPPLPVQGQPTVSVTPSAAHAVHSIAMLCLAITRLNIIFSRVTASPSMLAAGVENKPKQSSLLPQITNTPAAAAVEAHSQENASFHPANVQNDLPTPPPEENVSKQQTTSDPLSPRILGHTKTPFTALSITEGSTAAPTSASVRPPSLMPSKRPSAWIGTTGSTTTPTSVSARPPSSMSSVQPGARTISVPVNETSNRPNVAISFTVPSSSSVSNASFATLAPQVSQAAISTSAAQSAISTIVTKPNGRVIDVASQAPSVLPRVTEPTNPVIVPGSVTLPPSEKLIRPYRNKAGERGEEDEESGQKNQDEAEGKEKRHKSPIDEKRPPLRKKR
jgi:hypothetical protein